MDHTKAFNVELLSTKSSVFSFKVVDRAEGSDYVVIIPHAVSEGVTTSYVTVTQALADAFPAFKTPTQKIALLNTVYSGEEIVAAGSVYVNVIVVEGDELKFWLQDSQTGEYLTKVSPVRPVASIEISDETKAAFAKAIEGISGILSEHLETEAENEVKTPELSNLGLLLQMSEESGCLTTSKTTLPTSLHTKLFDGYYVTGYLEEGCFIEVGRISSFVDDDTLVGFAACCKKQFDRVNAK